MKKLITIGSALTAALVLGLSASAANMKFTPLLSGYNILVPTNSTIGLNGLTGVNASNVLFTTAKGQIVLSYSNNVGGFPGGTTTNLMFGDAFQSAKLGPDANGDMVANASIYIAIGNTNYLPIVCSNSTGQLFIPTSSTNGALPYWGALPAIWPLAATSALNWDYPASTNVYPNFVTGTNALVVTVYREPAKGFAGDVNGPGLPLWETSGNGNAIFTFTATPTANVAGSTPYVVITNLPASFMQGAGYIAVSITGTPVGTASGANSLGVLVNEIGVLQPVP